MGCGAHAGRIVGRAGLKPTRGRVVTSTGADPPVGMNTEGVLTRSVRDDLLIRVAAALELAAPWAHRRPPVM